MLLLQITHFNPTHLTNYILLLVKQSNGMILEKLSTLFGVFTASLYWSQFM